MATDEPPGEMEKSSEDVQRNDRETEPVTEPLTVTSKAPSVHSIPAEGPEMGLPRYEEEPIPTTYRIDLSLPPAERYVQLATDMGPKMREMTSLFDETLCYVIRSARIRKLLEFIASFVLRRVYSREENEELRGISKASGVAMWFLVALNVLLDSLLGCTGGGAVVRPNRGDRRGEEGKGGLGDRMMHFRTLDWEMDGLRDVIVVLEFVRSRSETPDEVIARSITYAGFVGCVTGVRENLSVSLNFRPIHQCKTFALRWHQFLVLFGFRQSIISVLRDAVLKNTAATPLSNLVTTLASSVSSPCYIILCDGEKATVIEKDLHVGKIRTSDAFIVATNDDKGDNESRSSTKTNGNAANGTSMPAQPHVIEEKPEAAAGPRGALEAILDASRDRRLCLQDKWDDLKAKQTERTEGTTAVSEETLKDWVREDPVMNELTHFACLMDPKMGTIRWLERGDMEYSDSDGEDEDDFFDPELQETPVARDGNLDPEPSEPGAE